MNRAGVEMVDYDRIFDLTPDVVNALQSASVDELIELYNQWDDAPDYVYPMDALDDMFSKYAPNASPLDIIFLVSSPFSSIDPYDEYFAWDGITSPDGSIESFTHGDDVVSYLTGFFDQMAEFVIKNDNPTMIKSVEDVLYPDE